MNLQRIVAQFPDKDLRRIDLMIGEKELWGRGYGTEAIGLLVEFGFQKERADAIFAPVAADNHRSQRAFQKNGFTCHARIQEPDGRVNTDLVVWRTDRRGISGKARVLVQSDGTSDLSPIELTIHASYAQAIFEHPLAHTVT